jgi:indole-3-glycerol phosphate synthase
MNILDKIVKHKKDEVEMLKTYKHESKFLFDPLFSRKCISLYDVLNSNKTTGIIAEFKRKSPSKGFINEHADVLSVTNAYSKGGAACLSILTDEFFFGGTNKDLIKARKNNIPILRKDFIVDQYQITEAKALGADVILLIAACLSKKQVKEFAAHANEIGLEVLLEIHNEAELEHICDEIKLVGINNRNLKNFEVDINASINLASKLPNNKIKIAESGIDSVETIKILQDVGFKGFLIGENFMKSPNPGEAFDNFVKKLKA